MLVFLLWLALAGLIVGALGRLVLPGPDPMSIGMTILIGIGGSVLAGLISYAIWGRRYGPGLLLSVACAAFFVWLVRRSRPTGVV
jgi:uncharacterized membrane protein YeaQ/YmgE (transglycosylase-associated protein family)